nr:immunoglobulin light chain junction region [Macaca mulatta]
DYYCYSSDSSGNWVF